MDNFGGKISLEDAIRNKKAVYITTIPITFELWNEMMYSQKILMTGPPKELLLHHLGEPDDFYTDEDDDEDKAPGDAWLVDIELYSRSSTINFKVYIGNETNWGWGISFVPPSLEELRRRNLLLCGMDLAIWCYQENGEPKLIAQSEFWSRDGLMLLVCQLAPSPDPDSQAPAPPMASAPSLAPETATSPVFDPEQGGEDGDE